MKTISILIVLIGLAGCAGCGCGNSNMYENERFIILSTNERVDINSDNAIPPAYKVWLIQRLDSVASDSIECAEITNNKADGYAFHLTNELWYNKHVGDIIFFEKINKNRFFKTKLTPVEVSKVEPVATVIPNNTKYADMSKVELKILISELEKILSEK